MTGIPPVLPVELINDWVQFHINFSNAASEQQYTWSYKSSANIVSPTTLNGFCQDLWTLIVVPWKTIHPTSTQLNSVTAETRYPSALNYTGTYLAPAPTFGNSASPVLPGNVALAWAKLSGVRGRRYNGRTFLGQLTEADAAGDTAVNAYMTASALFMAQHLTAMIRDSVTLSPAIASRAGAFMTEINRVRASNFLDSQRRRLIGRGS